MNLDRKWKDVEPKDKVILVIGALLTGLVLIQVFEGLSYILINSHYLGLREISFVSAAVGLFIGMYIEPVIRGILGLVEYLAKHPKVKNFKQKVDDDSGQFSIQNVFFWFLGIIVLSKVLPMSYTYTTETADAADAAGDPVTALLIRLFPMSVALVYLSIPFYWGRTRIAGLVKG